MPFDNLHVKQEQERTEQEYWAGAIEGYDANPNELPDFVFKVYAWRWTARQRGIWDGRQVRAREMRGEG